MKNKHDDPELAALLDLDGFRHYNRDDGYWVKFEVSRVEPTRERPHGIKYFLTLHDRNGTRIIGFDNVHNIKGPKRKSRKYGGRRVVYDHKHELQKVYPYDFESPGQLLTDFWEEVGRIAEIM